MVKASLTAAYAKLMPRSCHCH